MAGGLKKIFGVLLVFSICIFCSNFAEAKAQISWTTTDVILDSKKCTVKGYFTNTGDEGARVTKMHFIVNAVNGKKQNIYSAIFDIVPTDCYITPGQQRNWSFSLNDNACPRYTKNDLNWSVTRNISWE